MAPSRLTPSRTGESRRDAGFTVLEFLIAAAILLIVLVGIVPIFTRSLAANISGEESTQASIHGRSSLEVGAQRPFNNWELEITAGTERINAEHWTSGNPTKIGDEGWVAGQLPGGTEDKWTRTTTVRQFQLIDIDDTDGDGVIDRIVGLEDADGDGYFDSPMPAGTPRQAIHVKEFTVQLDNERASGVLGSPADLLLRYLKSF